MKYKIEAKLILSFMTLLVILPALVFAGTIQLPQTGQTKCYDPAGSQIACTNTGQDGDIQAGVVWPDPRFTVNADTTITDKLTGLAWAQNGNLMSSRDPGFDNDGTANDGLVTWYHALDYVAALNNENYLGHNDWRLPNVNELESLTNDDEANSATWLNSKGFSNISQSYYYWTSTTNPYPTNEALCVRVASGERASGDKSTSPRDNNYVWPVRSAQQVNIWKTGQTTSYYAGDDGALQMGVAWPSPRFVDIGDGTVTDRLTGLMWTKNANPWGNVNWQQALDNVKTVNTGGYTDWRLPNKNELRSLLDYSQHNPSLPSGHPFTNLGDYYWSSTTGNWNRDSAFIVGMARGLLGAHNKSGTTYNYTYYAWPVRGEQYWSYTYGGSQADGCGALQATSDGGYIVAGSTESFSNGRTDFWVLKLDNQGKISWQKRYGGSGLDSAQSIIQTTDNGYIVQGYTQNYGAGQFDILLLKLDNNGNIIWQRAYGGPNWERAYKMTQTLDNGCVIGGYTGTDPALGGSTVDMMVLKVDADGNISWMKTYGGSNGDEGGSIIPTLDNGYLMTGHTASFGVGGYDVFVLKLDGSGNVTWMKTYGGSSNDLSYSDVLKNEDGSYMVSGITDSFGAGSSDIWLLKIGSDGTILWQKTYGGPGDEVARSFQHSTDGGYFLTGQTTSFGAGSNDTLLLKLDSEGTIVWQKTYGGTGDDYANAVRELINGDIILAGYENSTGAGGQDYWVMKVNSGGNIPDCNISGMSNVVVGTTNVVPQSVSISAVNFPNPITTETHFTPGDTAVAPSPFCNAVEPTTAKDMTAFSLPSQVSSIIEEDGTNGTITVTMPYGTPVTDLVAMFTTTGVSVTVGGILQESGVTHNDFSSDVTYTVTAEDTSSKSYTVHVEFAPSSAKEITTFSLPSQVSSIIEEDGTNGTITVTMPYGTPVTDLVATFSTTGASVTVNGTPQESGVTHNDFSSDVTYTVTAEDTSTKIYTVHVEFAPNSAKEITAFSLPSQVSSIIEEDGTNGTITVTMPYGYTVNDLVATFTTTGASVKVGTVLQESGVTHNNFSSSVLYTVTAEDTSTKTYHVTVTVEANPDTAIWYVDGSVSSGSGTTWGTAFKTIQEAVDAADLNDEIWVKAGPLPYSLSSEIVVNKAVGIYGGFAGMETLRNERNWVANETIVDGNNAVRCFSITADATVDGFTITGGNASTDPYLFGGGGVYSRSDSVAIRNCKIKGNMVSANAAFGGGISNHGGLDLTNCTVTQNTAQSGIFVVGGGISNIAFDESGEYAGTSVMRVVNCTIGGNQATGGAIGGDGIFNGGNLTVINSILWGNGEEIYDEGGCTVTYSDIDQAGYGNTDGSADSNGNIRLDPLFVNLTSGNYRLQGSSPCIDAGTSDNAPLTDFDGKPRFDMPSVPNTGGSSYDMGAYEYVDTDNDGVPDDGDNDGIPGDHPCTGGVKTDCDDNCPNVENPNQEDGDGNGIGDACEIGRTFYISTSITDANDNHTVEDAQNPLTPWQHIPILMKNVLTEGNIHPGAYAQNGDPFVLQVHDTFVLRRGDKWEGVYLRAYLPEYPDVRRYNMSNITITSNSCWVAPGSNSSTLPAIYGYVKTTSTDWTLVSGTVYSKAFTPDSNTINKTGVWAGIINSQVLDTPQVLRWQNCSSQNPPAPDAGYWYYDRASNTVFINLGTTLYTVDPFTGLRSYNFPDATNVAYISTSNYGIFAVGDGWTIENLDIGYYDEGVMIYKLQNLSPWTYTPAETMVVQNCKIHDMESVSDNINPVEAGKPYGQGINNNGGVYNIYTKNEIYNISTSNRKPDPSWAHGMYVGCDYSNSTINFNYIHDCPAGAGIQIVSNSSPAHGIKIYGNVLEHNFIGTIFYDCQDCLFANNTIVNTYQPLDESTTHPRGLYINNVPNTVILNNLFYDPYSGSNSDWEEPIDVWFADSSSLSIMPIIFNNNYYVRGEGYEDQNIIVSDTSGGRGGWTPYSTNSWTEFISTYSERSYDSSSLANSNIPFVDVINKNWAITQSSDATHAGTTDIFAYVETDMVLLDPNSSFPSQVIPASAGAGQPNIGAYNCLLSTTTTSASASYVAPKAVSAPPALSSHAFVRKSSRGIANIVLPQADEQGPTIQRSGYFLYTESDGAITITGYETTNRLLPGGTVVIPSDIEDVPVVSIADWAFAFNSDLTSVTIPDSVTSIGNGAFASCSGLTSMTIPASVTKIGDGAFAGCSRLDGINLVAGNSVYSGQEGVLYNKDKTEIVQYPGGKAGGFTIPDGVTSIGPYAFAYCQGLTSVTIPNSVTSIGAEAFRNCHGLTSVTIPASVTSIGKYAFCGCTGLSYVTIGNSVTSIGEYAFYGCSSLTSVTIPTSVRSIGDIAFACCSSLTSAYFLGNAPTMEASVFDNCASTFTVYITDGSTGFDEPWNVYPTEVFQGCGGISDPWPADGSGDEINLYQIFNQTFDQQLTSSDQLSSLYGLADNLDDWWVSINQSGSVRFTVRYAGFDQELGILPLNGTYQPLVTNIPEGQQNTSVVINTPAQFAFVETESISVWYSVESMNPIQDGDHFKAFDVTDLYNSIFFANVSQAWLIAFEDMPIDQGGDCDYNDLVALVTDVEPTSIDSDSDGISDDIDNCPNKPNGPELGMCSSTSDKSGVNCTSDADCVVGCSSNGLCIKDQGDTDGDGFGDVCDFCDGNGAYDTDNDGYCDGEDNCPDSCNSQQLDADGDGIGDVCDTDPGCGGCTGIQCEQQC